MVTVNTRVRRVPATARRVGYAVAVNATLLYALNEWPGWQVVPVLTGDTRQVQGLLSASIIAGPWSRSAHGVHSGDLGGVSPQGPGRR
jgi:hypothetical protein